MTQDEEAKVWQVLRDFTDGFAGLRVENEKIHLQMAEFAAHAELQRIELNRRVKALEAQVKKLSVPNS